MTGPGLRMLRWGLFLGVIGLLCASTQPAEAKNPGLTKDGLPVYDIPCMTGITVDGNGTDWKNRGFRVELMADINGRTQPKSSFDPNFRLAWDQRGLLILLTVEDDVFIESADESGISAKDSVEIFMSSKPGTRDLYVLTLSPGMTPDHPELRGAIAGVLETERRWGLSYEAARGNRDHGYILEVLLPWTNFDIIKREGDLAGFQIVVNDADAPNGCFHAVWHPQTSPRENKSALAWLRLARKPSPPDRARVWGGYDDTARVHIEVLTLGELSDKPVYVQKDRGQKAQGTLERAGDYASAQIRFPMPAKDNAGTPWRVRAGKAFDVLVNLPSAEIIRAQRVMLLGMAAKPPVFQGEDFPACDFADPLLAERLLGPYRIVLTFYDAAFHPVTHANAPGRYGVVFEIIPENGKTFHRYSTLFRAPGDFNSLFSWWYLDPALSMRLPGFAAADASVASAQSESLEVYFKNKILDDLYKGQEAAVLFAGLFDCPPGQSPVNVTNDVWAMDRQWWVTLKRKLNGTESAYPNPLVCPYEKEGEPAPILREGSEQEAGMKPDTANAIDTVCQNWAAESKEPFAVCLARHGVVFFHKAYGERYGVPMTTDTKSWMASISKFLSGALMMTLVDQGLVEIDAPVDRYLPAFRDIPVPHPLTIRHLYTHTGGLGLGLWPPRMYVDHWGDMNNDFEEIIAGYYPCLEVGARHAYNGAGHALGGKIIETITGEALPQCFYKHLWKPLGCEHTRAKDGSAYTMSIPLDIAKFAQMLLNRGAYGNMRFFREETFEKMLPVKLAPYVHFETNQEWGMGPVWTREPGLSDSTIGHGAASAATLRIDLDNDLIIVMTRNTAGPAFAKYHPQFIQAIADGLPH